MTLARATLRPHQEHGVGWLGWIADAGPGGLLADDMGLGKTLQVLEALAREHQARGSLRALIVTTTSTLENWRAEIEKFVPWLRVAVWAGKERHELASIVWQHEIVLTSYAVARLDVEELASHPLDWAILDEAQTIKNREASTYAMARALRARRRLAMTGTPMENSPDDFHAILDWAVPGLLGSAKWFADHYGAALRKGDDARAEALHRVIAPYMLRRRKSEVARDLPSKREEVELVQLPPVQRRVYDQVEAAAVRALEHAEDGDAASRMAVFAALLRLRQVACDPRLVGVPYAEGGKLRALARLLLEAKRAHEKALVFSSFPSLFPYLTQDLARLGVRCVALDGSTRDRPAVIDQFSNDSSITAFLISLKAGGAGLNLTAANLVVHFDPWWNPAALDQATDRAYRIGQHKDVRVVSLVAASTIEQRVVATLGQKKDVANLLLGEESGKTSQFAHTVSDLLALLRAG